MTFTIGFNILAGAELYSEIVDKTDAAFLKVISQGLGLDQSECYINSAVTQVISSSTIVSVVT